MSSSAVKQLFDIYSLITRSYQKLALGDAYGWTEIFEYAYYLEVLAAEQAGQKLQAPIYLKAASSAKDAHYATGNAGKSKTTVKSRGAVE